MLYKKVTSYKLQVTRKDKNSKLATCHLPLATHSGFTLVELMVVVGIFVFMTALVVANYGSFNDGSLLTSMSYDVALALRDAQSYGLNVQGEVSGTSQNFTYPYGMDFNLGTPNQMILFADSNPLVNDVYGDGIYTPSGSNLDTLITTYTLARGGLIKSLCVTNNPSPSSSPSPSPSSSSQPSGSCIIGSSVNSIDITFKRPDPNAIIKANGGASGTTYAYAIIQVEDASKTSTRSIVVNETGEIAVQNQ
jgi:prepilin-type N-terminal cleavage/methylation domain-containing protein